MTRAALCFLLCVWPSGQNNRDTAYCGSLVLAPPTCPALKPINLLGSRHVRLGVSLADGKKNRESGISPNEEQVPEIGDDFGARPVSAGKAKTRNVSSFWLPEATLKSFDDDLPLVQLPLPQPPVDEAASHVRFSPDFQPRELLRSNAPSWPKAKRLYAENLLLDGAGSFLAALRREYEEGNLFNFAPVMLAFGIVAYFMAPAEPRKFALLASMVVMVILLMQMRSRGIMFFAAISGLLFFSGMGVAQWQVERVRMPVPLSDMTTVIEGTIMTIDQNRSGAPRYLITPSKIEGLSIDELPLRIRLSAARAHAVLEEGDIISGLARMSPVSGPAYPGGYDFSFAAMFDGLGMSGFFMGAPDRVANSVEPGINTVFNLNIERIRREIANRIRAGLPGESGDIAVALITGDRSGLSSETQESLRRSGLAHILAISGLHMALVTLTVIWLVRLALVVIPGLVESFPVRKAAILAGFITATAYLFLSGQAIATQRAWLMISVMLVASLLDRRAITMRSVAIAALLILLASPASLFQPGFQMSFAAVAALVAVYREWSNYRQSRREVSGPKMDRSPIQYYTIKSLEYFGGLATTSLIAGLATALFALWHFHRVAPMGLVSNLAAMPIVSVAVMPLALLSMFLMPYGFEQVALKPLGSAVNAVLAVSDHVNSRNLDFDAGMQPLSVLIASAFFLVLACCLRTRLRWLSLLPLVILFTSISRQPEIPDILISQDGKSIAINTRLVSQDPDQSNRETKGGLTLLYPGRGAFITEIWQRAYLPNRKFAALPDKQHCDNDRCVVTTAIAGWKSIAVIYDPDQLQTACNESDILIAPRLWWVRCRGKHQPVLILKRSDFEARGAHALFLQEVRASVKVAWPVSQSDFEKAEALRDEAFRNGSGKPATSGSETPNIAAPDIAASVLRAETDRTYRSARPWQERFDNISRRFAN